MEREQKNNMEIKKSNREKRLEAEKRREIVHLPILNLERIEPRTVRDRRIAEIVKKARKKV